MRNLLRLSAFPLILACLGGSVGWSADSLSTSDQGLTGNRLHRLGVGVQVGDPTEANLKYFVSTDDALVAGVGFGPGSSVEFHGDVLHHFTEAIPVKQGLLPIYVGIGGRLRQRDDHHDETFTLGVRGTVGVAYWFASCPVELYAEVNPVLDLISDRGSDVNFDLDAGLGARWYF